MPEERAGGWLGSEWRLTPYHTPKSGLTRTFGREGMVGVLRSVKDNEQRNFEKGFDKTAVSPYNCPVP